MSKELINIISKDDLKTIKGKSDDLLLIKINCV